VNIISLILLVLLVAGFISLFVGPKSPLFFQVAVFIVLLFLIIGGLNGFS
jgi:hypothetical protein